MICGLIAVAVEKGALRRDACAVIGLDARTEQRWRRDPDADDRRTTPRHRAHNQFTEQQEATFLATLNSPAFRNLSPNEIVPLLADQGRYLASASTFYRLLRKHNQLAHRTKAKSPQPRNRPRELVATGPNQVWSWDITYLHTPVRGCYFFLYLLVDVWSRKIVGWAIHEHESGELAAELVTATCAREGVTRAQLVLHSDNGGPMKHATLYATLTVLGVASSHSRPHVSDDNAFSESLFRVLKYCTEYPAKGQFASLDHAQEWMLRFEAWYNHVHLHSGIRYVTPAQRHDRLDIAILVRRNALFEAARKLHPERWTGKTRDWSYIAKVVLNPEPVASSVTAA